MLIKCNACNKPIESIDKYCKHCGEKNIIEDNFEVTSTKCYRGTPICGNEHGHIFYPGEYDVCNHHNYKCKAMMEKEIAGRTNV